MLILGANGTFIFVVSAQRGGIKRNQAQITIWKYIFQRNQYAKTKPDEQYNPILLQVGQPHTGFLPP